MPTGRPEGMLPAKPWATKEAAPRASEVRPLQGSNRHQATHNRVMQQCSITGFVRPTQAVPTDLLTTTMAKDGQGPQGIDSTHSPYSTAPHAMVKIQMKTRQGAQAARENSHGRPVAAPIATKPRTIAVCETVSP